MKTTPLYISANGGSIVSFRGEGGHLFRACFADKCLYCNDFDSAKMQLERMESKGKYTQLDNPKKINIPRQRKTTLKWNSNGELSEIDMARVLDMLTNPQLTECDLTCDLNDQK